MAIGEDQEETLDENGKPYHFVYTQANGKQMCIDTPTQRFSKLIADYNSTVEKEADKLPNISLHGQRHSHASLLISMRENPLLIKERLGHEKIHTTLGTYGHLYPNSNLEATNKLTGVLTYTPASHSIADYTSNQHTAIYHREVE